MQRFWVLTLICFLFLQCPSYAFFQKKDYKQIFLNNAHNAEKRHDDKSAFHSYEKAMYYYKTDKTVIEEYAKFCERRNYLDKASELYRRLFIMTKDPQYQIKADICDIKNGKLTDDKIKRLDEDKTLSAPRRKELNRALVSYYEYKKDYKRLKSVCEKLPAKDIGLDIINACTIASHKAGDTKALLKYQIRHHELSPNDSEVINRIITSAEKLNDFKTQEIFIKKLLALNPEDNGIKYKLAGIYEKHNKWLLALKVYEGLMVSGDRSEHVKNSYNYVKLRLAGKTGEGFEESKPLSGYKLAEKRFYQAWKAKDYVSAQLYLEKMLKEKPDNKKLLKHRVDIDVAQENYAKAIEDFEKIGTKNEEDNKFLAFLYSKIGDNKKALEIIACVLEKNPDNTELNTLAFQYSMAAKDWDSAIYYNQKLLAKEPDSEELLKNAGDLQSIKQNFNKAAIYYEKLVKYYPKPEYQEELANLYMADRQFEAAEQTIAALYAQYPDNEKITAAYLNTLLAQRKTEKAYAVVKEANMGNTRLGQMVFGDLAMENKNFNEAVLYYYNALKLNPESLTLQNKLADSYRLAGYKKAADSLYRNVLRFDPKNPEARLGLGELEIDKKRFSSARKIFNSVLQENPDYKPAKVAIVNSYLANDEKFSALEALEKIEDDNETKYIKAQIFYNMDMHSDSKDEIKNVDTLDAKKLRDKIRKDNAFILIPSYSGFYQTLANEFNLDYQKYGLGVSQDINKNANIFANYNIYWYQSGAISYLENVTNEIRGGIQGRPNAKMEYRADFGVKIFQHHGAMLNTNSWIKYYINDFLNLKVGYYRDNLEQSYTSAVGQYIDGIFTGQVADNRVYLEYEAKLPQQYYSFGRFSYGFLPAQNLITNNYFEGYIGIGKAFYNKPENPWLNTIAFDIVTYNSAYQYDLLDLYSTSGTLFGGYFSPSYFNATTGNLKIEGYIKQLKLHYGVKAFAGVQNAITPNFTNLTWGVSPYISFDINDHLTFNASYEHFNFAEVRRDIFTLSLVIRGFSKHDKK